MGEESPKNKVKFLCSYGGKVLPRPSDGILKYVGGETRVICVPRDVTFSELMKKVSGIVDIGEVVLKYQLVPEDLDTLVAVRTQEDVKHMMEEQDRHESVGLPMLRAFLFPTKPVLVDNNNNNNNQQQAVPIEPYWLEQRYIDAINGIIRTSPSPRGAYSACCSPKSNSPDGQTTTTADSPFHPSHSLNQNRIGHLTMMPKVHSSPNLSNLTSTSNNNIQPHRDHHHHHHHHHANIPHNYHHPLHYPPSPTSSFASRQDPQIGMGGIGGGGGGGGGRGFNYYYSTATRQHKPSAYHEDSVAPYANATGPVMIERVHSVPRSRSPRNTIWE